MKTLTKLFAVALVATLWFATPVQAKMMPFSAERFIQHSPFVIEGKLVSFEKQTKYTDSNGMKKMHSPLATIEVTNVLKGKIEKKKIKVLFAIIGPPGCIRSRNPKLITYKDSQLPKTGTTWILFCSKSKDGLFHLRSNNWGRIQTKAGLLSKQAVKKVLDKSATCCNQKRPMRLTFVKKYDRKLRSYVLKKVVWKCRQCKKSVAATAEKKAVLVK